MDFIKTSTTKAVGIELVTKNQPTALVVGAAIEGLKTF